MLTCRVNLFTLVIYKISWSVFLAWAVALAGQTEIIIIRTYCLDWDTVGVDANRNGVDAVGAGNLDHSKIFVNNQVVYHGEGLVRGG